MTEIIPGIAMIDPKPMARRGLAPPPADTPLSCYLLPAFWRGALAIREKDIPSNGEMMRAIQELEAVAGRRDLRSLPAYHRWLSQSTRGDGS